VSGMRSVLTLKQSLLSDSREGGLIVYGADAIIEDVVVRRTEPQPSSLYGDGFGVANFDDRPTTASMTRSRIESSARAGVSSFGSHVELSSTHVDCAAFSLDAEPVDGVNGVIVDGGYNQCGCAGGIVLCAVESAKLQPPTPIE
jgi:hypothetical protein